MTSRIHPQPAGSGSDAERDRIGFKRTGSPESSDPRLSFRLAQEVPDLGFRQTLLTMRSEAERMRRIAEFLPGYLERRRRFSTPRMWPAATARRIPNPNECPDFRRRRHAVGEQHLLRAAPSMISLIFWRIPR